MQEGPKVIPKRRLNQKTSVEEVARQAGQNDTDKIEQGRKVGERAANKAKGRKDHLDSAKAESNRSNQPEAEK